MTGYDFHPNALADLDAIWDFIAQDSIAAAERVVGDILAGIRKLVISPPQGHSRTGLTSRPLRSGAYGTISLLMRRMKSRYG